MFFIYFRFSAIAYLSWQYLVPFRNPSEINCLLPQRFRNFQADSPSKNDTVMLYFTPVHLRTTLIFVGVVAYFLVFLSASKGFKLFTKNNSDKYTVFIYIITFNIFLTLYISFVWWNAEIFSPGINLLKHIEDERVKKLLSKFKEKCLNTDLHLIMGLAYVNRDRLQFIQ